MTASLVMTPPPTARQKCAIVGVDFYTPPVLGGAALFDDSGAAVFKIQGP